MPNPGRAKNGKFRRNPETAEQIARATDMYGRGCTYREIAQELGWADAATAAKAIERAYQAFPGPSVEAAKMRSIERLDLAHRKAREIMDTDHILVSQGRVMLHPHTGQPLQDYGPNIQAIDRIVKIEQRLAAIVGFNAPVKHAVYEIQRDAMAEEMEAMMRELEANDAKTPEGDASGLVNAGGVDGPGDAG